MAALNEIGTFHDLVEKLIKKDTDNDREYNRSPFDKVVADGINYRCVMDSDVKKGKLIKVPNWSGTTFTVRTKDGQELTYTLSYTDIRDKDELNKMILTMRKFASDLTLVQTRKAIKGKTFSITEKLGNASNYVCLLQLDGPRGLRPYVTGSRYHFMVLGLGSATQDNKQGFYGLDLGRLMPGQNGRIKTFLYSLLNGYMRGSAGAMLNFVNPKLPKLLQLATSGLLLEDMNTVAGDVQKYAKKYGKGDELWQANKKLQMDNPRRVTEEPRPVEVDLLGDDLDLLAADLVERNYMLKAKQAKLRSHRLWGTEISETLKPEIKTLQEDVAGLHQAILFRKMDNEGQKEAIGAMGVLWQMRKKIRTNIAEERNAHDLAHVDTHQMEQQKQRVQRVIDQIQEIITLRTILIRQPDLDNGHLDALDKAQTALLNTAPLSDKPDTLDATMNGIDRLIDRAKAILFDLNDEVEKAVEKDKLLESLAKEHKCTIEQLTDAQAL